MPEAVIVATARSPIGRAFKGALANERPDDLTAQMITHALKQLPELDPKQIDDILVGCGMPGGEQGFNLARVVALLLGLETVPGATITRYCSSSLQTTRMAFHAIKAGEGDVFISAGVEMVSRFVNGSSDTLPNTENPVFAAAKARTERFANGEEGPWQPDELVDAYIPMGQTAENVASLKNVSRERMDDFAFQSQTRYQAAKAAGFYAKDITPVTLSNGTVMSEDESPRQAERAAMANLDPVFRPGGTVTAGNACPLNDGAAALVIMSDTKAKQLGITPLARIVSTGVTGLHPEIMGLGPIEASRQALARAGMTVADMDIVEINEAFAAQVLPSADELGVDEAKLNPHGGAIALGHPFGMTGARITSTLINGLQATDGTFGLETMCVGGGQGMAMVVERLS